MLTIVALAAIVALYVVLAAGDDDRSSAVRAQPAQGATPARSTPAEPAQDAHAAETVPAERQEATTATRRSKGRRPAIRRIVVRGGKPVGGVKRLEYERGERVRFSVRSDTAEEVHVHGFDLSKDVPAGGTVRFSFAADIEGVFEVELEHSHVHIAELRVSP